MAFTCSTGDFPSLTSYAEARAHFDSVKPWRSKYNPDGDERPIGGRACKLNDRMTEYATKFNKAMRELGDGSIAFRLFDTDCVIYHPDGTLTVQGYASMSTTAFIGALTPAGVIHGKGMKDAGEPILHLTRIVHHDSSWGGYDGPDWIGGEIIQCSFQVRLQCRKKLWVPVEPDKLSPFHVPVIDRRAAREASRHYNLPTLEKVLNATYALARPPAVAGDPSHYQRMNAILDALEREAYVEAISWMPRGTKRVFGRRVGTEDGIEPGFVRELRDHIYDQWGAITRVEQRSLTPAQYKRYVHDTNRFY